MEGVQTESSGVGIGHTRLPSLPAVIPSTPARPLSLLVSAVSEASEPGASWLPHQLQPQRAVPLHTSSFQAFQAFVFLSQVFC